ncbi:hypothetical protein [Nonomuraea ceibae]|uniref:hypothetical protein n=1 Tax=Nonomuraea ceibae TaxID=1935170 RepID=UPI001C5D19D6|nr:hypothetical protein [Nonomuraea ceibae]
MLAAAVPAVPAAANGVSMVLDQMGNPDGVLKWIRTGDVLRYQVRLKGMGHDARLAVATVPAAALTTVACPATGAVTGPVTGVVPEAAASAAPAPVGAGVPPEGVPGRVAGARVTANRALSGTVDAGARVCPLGQLAGKQVVDVTLTVPQGAGEVELAAVAKVREDDGLGHTTIARSVRTAVFEGPVPRDVVGFSGNAVRLTQKAAPPAAVPPRPGGHSARPSRQDALAQRDASRQERLPAQDAPALNAAPSVGGAPAPGDATTRRRTPPVGGAPAPGDPTARGRTPSTGSAPAQRGASAQKGATAHDAPALSAAPSVGGAPAPGGATVRGYAPYVADAPALGGATAVGGVPDRQGMPAPGGAPAAGVAVAPVQTGQPVEAVEAPLPREVGGGRMQVRAEEAVNPLAGPRGVPAVAVGIAALMGTLWLIARVQRARIQKNVW